MLKLYRWLRTLFTAAEPDSFEGQTIRNWADLPPYHPWKR